MFKKKEKQAKEKKLTRKKCIGLVLLCLIVCLAFMIIGAVIAEIAHWSDALMYLGEIAGVVLCIFMIKEQTGEKLSSKLKFKGFDFSVPVMIVLFDWGFNHIFTHLIGLIGSHFTTVKPNGSEEDLIEFILTGVILAPICEELLFRFCNISILRQKFGRVFTIIATGVLFAAVHLYNIQGFAEVMVGGILYAYIFMKTNNILYTMGAHALHNALCLMPMEKICISGVPMYYEVNGFSQYSVPYLIICAVLAAAAMVYYIKYFRPKFIGEKNDLTIELVTA